MLHFKWCRKIVMVGLGFGMILPVGLSAENASEQHQITVRVRGEHWTYSHEQLLELADTTLANSRGTRDKPAISFEKLLFKDTGLTADQVKRVLILRRDGMPVVLQAKDLAYLDKLVLTSGADKSEQGHPWAPAPEDDATHDALLREVGSRRKHLVLRIDITPKDDVEPSH